MYACIFSTQTPLKWHERRAAPRRAVRRLSALCRAGPRCAETPEKCTQTFQKRSTSGGTRLGPPLISGGPNRGSSPKSQNETCIKTQRRQTPTINEDKTPTVDGIKFVTSTKLKKKLQCHTTSETKKQRFQPPCPQRSILACA